MSKIQHNQPSNRLNTQDNPYNQQGTLSQGHVLQMPKQDVPQDKKRTLTTTLECSGNKPSPRFGHSMILINKVKTVLFGGAIGTIRSFSFANDTYVFNLMTKLWIKINFPSTMQLPHERAAHAAAANDNTQMVIHGGSAGTTTLADDELWLFDMSHNNEEKSSWRLIQTSGKTPGLRYGHSLAFMKPYFVLFGGGSLIAELSNDVWIIDINKEQPSWTKVEMINGSAPSPRLYHTCGFAEKGDAMGMMIVFGGRDSSENSLNDIWGLRKLKDNKWDWTLAPVSHDCKLQPRYNHSVIFYKELMIILGGRTRKCNRTLPIEVYSTSNNQINTFPGVGFHRQSSFYLDGYIYLYGGFTDENQVEPLGHLSCIALEKLFEGCSLLNILDNRPSQIGKSLSNAQQSNKAQAFKLSYTVVVGEATNPENEPEDDGVNLFRKVSIDKLQEENKRIGEIRNANINNLLLLPKREFNIELINYIIVSLLRPFEWFDDEKMEHLHKTLFADEQIEELLDEVKIVLSKESSLIRLKSPCKIFGNLYGNYYDLMRYFESFGNPSDSNQNGDINVMQYIFLGDFCDRGKYSLEVVLLLFALKVKYPEHIILLRGHHEDIEVNAYYGLGSECKERLKDDIGKELCIFRKINKVFDLLPLAALIDNSVLCVHGGIGSALNSLSEIENIKRPIQVKQSVTNRTEQIVIDLLWSEYSDSVDSIEMNVDRDEKKYGFIVKFGKERLEKFLTDNELTMVINSHQFVQEGVMSFCNDKLLTVYSATNYMDEYKNNGGMLILGKRVMNKPINIMPRLINCFKESKENYRKNGKVSPLRNRK